MVANEPRHQTGGFGPEPKLRQAAGHQLGTVWAVAGELQLAVVVVRRRARLGDIVEKTSEPDEGRKRDSFHFAIKGLRHIDPGELLAKIASICSIAHGGVDRRDCREVVVEHIVVVTFGLAESAALLQLGDKGRQLPGGVERT